MLTRDMFAVANHVNLTCDKVHRQTDSWPHDCTDGRGCPHGRVLSTLVSLGKT